MTHTTIKEADEKADVAIIGCGPVGAMLANLLGSQGVSTVVLEREAAVYAQPRAVHFDDEIMRLLQTVGLAEAMGPLVHVSPGMLFVDDAERLLLDWSRPAELGPQGWHASYRFHQPDLERVLRAGLERHPSVSVATRVEAFAIEEGVDHATVRYEELATGALKVLRARYVVGCDGSRSLVRRLLGEPMLDLGFHERWLVVDAILKRPRPDLGDYSIQYCSRLRPATYVRGTGARRRWEIALLPGEDGSTVTRPDRVFELLQRWAGPDDMDLERVAVYTFHSALAQRWRRGRLMIAGDAAHLTPPFLGQGMCAGMRDAGNLAWKLTRILRGRSEDGLLDSYQTERAPHVREYIDLAVKLGALINASATGDDDPADGLRSDAVVQMRSIKPRLGTSLSTGWNGPAGQISPQARIGSGARIDDVVGYGYLALLRPAFAATLPAATLDRLADAEVMVLSDPAPGIQAWLEALGAQAVVVRPDRYVLGAAHTPDDLAALAALV